MADAEQMAAAVAEMRARLDEERGRRLAAKAGGKGKGRGDEASAIDLEVLNKCPTFSGRDEAWQEWSSIFESVCGMAGLEDALDAAGEDDAAIGMALLSPERQWRARQMWFMLVNTVRGKALTMVRGCEKQNGIAAWKKIKKGYQPDMVGRHTARQSILQPGWSREATAQEFMNDLNEWETKISK